jgi:hypothetical protein
MKIMSSRIFLLFLAALLLVGMASCGGGRPARSRLAAGARPARTLRPTFTPVPTRTQPAPTATPAPSATPLPPTATAPPAAPPVPQLTVSELVNVRGGPGTAYQILGQLESGQQFAITGRNADADWWQFDYNGDTGWVTGSLVTVNVPADAVQVVEAPPPPAPVVRAPEPAPQPQAAAQAQPQAPAQPVPQPSPAPQMRFAAAGSEMRNAANSRFDLITYWGRLGDTSTSGPVADAANYKLRVVGPTGTAEKAFTAVWEVAYSGLPTSQFLYDVKIELPHGAGAWTAVIVDGSGNKASDDQSGSLVDASHDVILTWRPR